MLTLRVWITEFICVRLLVHPKVQKTCHRTLLCTGFHLPNPCQEVGDPSEGTKLSWGAPRGLSQRDVAQSWLRKTSYSSILSCFSGKQTAQSQLLPTRCLATGHKDLSHFRGGFKEVIQWISEWISCVSELTNKQLATKTQSLGKQTSSCSQDSVTLYFVT